MKQISINDFNSYLNKQIGQPYVWGGQHLKLTPQNYVSVITKRETDEQHRADAIAYCKAKFDKGATVLYAYDCSGLGMYWLQNVKKVFPHDLNANGMMAQCDIVTEPKNGYWVFRLSGEKATHIGYMVSDKELIESKGRKHGVVRTKFKASAWQKVGKPNCIAFEEPEPEPEPVPEPGYVIKVRGSVRVRNGNGILHKTIAIVRNCTLPYLGQDSDKPNWYITQVNGVQGWITSNPKYTSVEEAVY